MILGGATSLCNQYLLNFDLDQPEVEDNSACGVQNLSNEVFHLFRNFPSFFQSDFKVTNTDKMHHEVQQ